MTIPKKRKGVNIHKKEEKSDSNKPLAKKNRMTKDTLIAPKNWRKDVKIEFEDEFLNNSLSINNILE